MELSSRIYASQCFWQDVFDNLQDVIKKEFVFPVNTDSKKDSNTVIDTKESSLIVQYILSFTEWFDEHIASCSDMKQLVQSWCYNIAADSSIELVINDDTEAMLIEFIQAIDNALTQNKTYLTVTYPYPSQEESENQFLNAIACCRMITLDCSDAQIPEPSSFRYESHLRQRVTQLEYILTKSDSNNMSMIKELLPLAKRRLQRYREIIGESAINDDQEDTAMNKTMDRSTLSTTSSRTNTKRKGKKKQSVSNPLLKVTKQLIRHKLIRDMDNRLDENDDQCKPIVDTLLSYLQNFVIQMKANTLEIDRLLTHPHNSIHPYTMTENDWNHENQRVYRPIRTVSSVEASNCVNDNSDDIESVICLHRNTLHRIASITTYSSCGCRYYKRQSDYSHKHVLNDSDEETINRRIRCKAQRLSKRYTKEFDDQSILEEWFYQHMKAFACQCQQNVGINKSWMIPTQSVTSTASWLFSMRGKCFDEVLMTTRKRLYRKHNTWIKRYYRDNEMFDDMVHRRVIEELHDRVREEGEAFKRLQYKLKIINGVNVDHKPPSIMTIEVSQTENTFSWNSPQPIVLIDSEQRHRDMFGQDDYVPIVLESEIQQLQPLSDNYSWDVNAIEDNDIAMWNNVQTTVEQSDWQTVGIVEQDPYSWNTESESIQLVDSDSSQQWNTVPVNEQQTWMNEEFTPSEFIPTVYESESVSMWSNDNIEDYNQVIPALPVPPSHKESVTLPPPIPEDDAVMNMWNNNNINEYSGIGVIPALSAPTVTVTPNPVHVSEMRQEVVRSNDSVITDPMTNARRVSLLKGKDYLEQLQRDIVQRDEYRKRDKIVSEDFYGRMNVNTELVDDNVCFYGYPKKRVLLEFIRERSQLLQEENRQKKLQKQFNKEEEVEDVVVLVKKEEEVVLYESKDNNVYSNSSIDHPHIDVFDEWRQEYDSDEFDC